MANPKKLNKLEEKWQKLVVIRKKRSSLARTKRNMGTDSLRTVADNDKLVVRTVDHKLCVIPSACLRNGIVREILKRSEQEFGVEINGLVRVSCSSFFMEYIIRLIQQGAAHNLEKSMLVSDNQQMKN